GTDGSLALLVTIVRPDDPGNELVADHILLVEVHERNTLDAPKDLARRDEAGLLALLQVDLGHVAGHDRLRTEPQASEEHLHLLRRGVLRFVEDDESLRERTATHVPQRRHLDLTSLHRAREALV